MKSFLHFSEETSMQHYAASLAHSIHKPCVIFLSGMLGAGKTTFVRGFLRALDFHGAVKSPSFSLVEEYHLKNQWIYHFDFYRIHNSKELAGIGLRDYLSEGILLIEWPEHALDVLPTPDLHYHIDIVELGRKVSVE